MNLLTGASPLALAKSIYYPGEIGNNGRKSCGVNKVHYGLCENGEWNTKLFLFNIFSLQKARFIV